MHALSSLPRTLAPAAVLIAIMLASCSGPTAPLPQKIATGDQEDTVAMLLRTLQIMHAQQMDTIHNKVAITPAMRGAIVTPWVNTKDYQSTTDSFMTHFRKDKGVPITDTTILIPWDTIAQYVPAHAATEIAGLIFNYGLEEPKFKIGINFITMEPSTMRADSFLIKTGTNEIRYWNGSRFVRYAASVWKRHFQKYTTSGSYFNEVETRSYDDGTFRDAGQTQPEPLDDDDPSAEIFPWELEILRMYQDNRALFGADKLYLGVHCISEPRTGKYRHALCLFLLLEHHLPDGSTTTRMLIDNKPYADKFTMRGCDMGNLCPPHCLSYIRPSSL